MTVDPSDPAANATTTRPARVRAGVVASFDGPVGLGEVLGDDGRRYLFQSIEIADGSREIEVGADVVFEPFARFGAWQAGRISLRCPVPAAVSDETPKSDGIDVGKANAGGHIDGRAVDG